MKRFCLTCKKQLRYPLKYYCKRCSERWLDAVKKKKEVKQ